MKVVSEEIKNMRSELMIVLKDMNNAFFEVFSELERTGTYLYCAHTEGIVNNAHRISGEMERKLNELEQHIDALNDIATLYENAEKENNDVIISLG